MREDLVDVADFIHNIILPLIIPIVSGSLHRSFVAKTRLDGEPKFWVVLVLWRDVIFRWLSSAL